MDQGNRFVVRLKVLAEACHTQLAREGGSAGASSSVALPAAMEPFGADAVDLDHCPHLNLDDARCNRRLTLERIEQAYLLCAGDYTACPLYAVLAASQSANPLVRTA